MKKEVKKMEMDAEKISLAGHIIKHLAKFHGEKNLAFYKELSEELFVRYAGFEDSAAGVATLSALMRDGFKKAKEELEYERELIKEIDGKE